MRGLPGALAATIALLLCREAIGAGADLGDYQKCVKEAQPLADQKRLKEYTAALEHCQQILQQTLTQVPGAPAMLERASTLKEALAKPDRIGTLAISVQTEKLDALPDGFAKLVNVEELSISGIDLGIGLSAPRHFDLRAALGKIAALPRLKTLRLGGDLKSVEVADGIGRLTGLQTLSLDRVDAIPGEIANLTHLETLRLAGPRISEVPASLGRLRGLKHLAVTGTSITTLPPEIGDLTDLVTLDLHGNKLATLPESMRRLNALTSLEIFENPVLDRGRWKEEL